MLNITDETFKNEVLDVKDTPVLVDFWATWCGPCKALSPVLETIAEKYEGTIKVVKMDVDTNPTVPLKYNVRGIPTLLLFINGNLVSTVVGFVNGEEIEDMIQKNI